MQTPDIEDNTMMPTRPVGLFLVIVAIFVATQGLAMLIPESGRAAAIIVTQLVVFLGGAYVYRKHFSRPETTWPTLRRLGMSPWALVMVIITSVSLGFLASALGGMTIQLFPALGEMADSYQQGMESLLLPEPLYAQILGAVAVAIVAPVAEEYLFRGTILAEQCNDQIAVSAILLNGILFSVMHFNPVAFVSLAVVGCYFAHITVRSDGLWGAVVGHAALNFVNGVVLIRVVEDAPAPEELAFAEIGVMLVILIPVTSLLWWSSVRMIGASDGDGDEASP